MVEEVGVGFKIALSGFSMMFVLAGVFIANKGRKARNKSKLIEETETTRIRELTPGKAEIKGKARPTEEGATVRSAIYRNEGLATKVKVEEYHSNTNGGGSWKTIYEDEEAVPFVVDDGTGEVRIDPPPQSERYLSVELNRERVGGGNEPPERIKEFIQRKQELDDAKNSIGPIDFGQRRRYSEGTVEPGESVYVFGKAREEDAGWGERGYVVDEQTASGEFMLSDKSEEKLVKEGKWGGTLVLVFGVVFALFGAVFVVVPWLFGGF